MSNKDNKDKKIPEPSQPCTEHFRLFSYLSMTILSIAIFVGMFIILQHLNEESKTETTLANQNTLLENQNYLKNITEELRAHELAEISVLEERKDISYNNSKKLDQVLDLLLRDKP